MRAASEHHESPCRVQHPGRRSDSLAPERICRSVCRRLAPQAAWRAQQCHLPQQPRLVPSCTVRHGAGAPPSSALPAWRARTKPPEGVPSAGRPFCLRGARERPSAAGAVRLRGLSPPSCYPLSASEQGARHRPQRPACGTRPPSHPLVCALARARRTSGLRELPRRLALGPHHRGANSAPAPRWRPAAQQPARGPFVCQETGRQVGSSAPLLTISRQPITIHQRGDAGGVRSLSVRPGDALVANCPRGGTAWTQALVSALRAE